MTWFPNQAVAVIHIEDWKETLDILVATGWNTAVHLLRIPATVKCYFVQSDETRFFPDRSIWKDIVTLTYYLGVNYFTEAKWIQDWLRKNFGHQAELIPNGLDDTLFYPVPPLQPRGHLPRVLLEGAIALPYKGMAEAFEVVAPLDVEVWCVSSLGTPKRGWKCHRFFEQVPMSDMRHIYSSCDVLLKLSRVEGFFGPPLEMMACGGAAVVGRVTGYDEYIIDGYNALVVDVDDVEAAREAVARVVSDKVLRDNLIANGQATVSKWKWEESIDKLENHFSRLLGSPDRWTNYSKRPEYDASLSRAYSVLSQHVPVENEVVTEGKNIPSHALTLGQYIISSPLFWRLSSFVRWCYRLRRQFLRFIHR